MNFRINKLIGWKYSPLALTVTLYILLYLVRLQQVMSSQDFTLSEILDPANIRFERVEKNIELEWLSSFRQTLDGKIDQFLPSPQAQLLSGVILGEKRSMPPEFRLALRDTSTLHIVVVSGQNLTMVAGFFLALSGLIKRRVAITLSFLAIIFYTLLTGAEVPVLRAAVMVSLAFLAQILGRQNDSFWILILTGGLMLLVNPQWLFDLSFQLSFMATLGLVVVTPILLKYLKFLPLIGQDLAVTVGAQLMVIPIIAANFHQFSLVGVITNILVGWSVPFIMILGIVMLSVSFISQSLGQLVALVVDVLATYFVHIVQFFGSLPFAWEYVGEKVWVVWVGYYMVVGGVLMAINKKLDVRSEKLDKEVRN